MLFCSSRFARSSNPPFPCQFNDHAHDPNHDQHRHHPGHTAGPRQPTRRHRWTDALHIHHYGFRWAIHGRRCDVHAHVALDRPTATSHDRDSAAIQRLAHPAGDEHARSRKQCLRRASITHPLHAVRSAARCSADEERSPMMTTYIYDEQCTTSCHYTIYTVQHQ